MGPSWPLGERTEETLSFAKEHTFFRVAFNKGERGNDILFPYSQENSVWKFHSKATFDNRAEPGSLSRNQIAFQVVRRFYSVFFPFRTRFRTLSMAVDVERAR